MHSTSHRRPKEVARKLLSILLVVCLSVPLFGPNRTVEAAIGDTITYSFPALAGYPDAPNWFVKESNPPNLRLTATSYQLINGNSSPAVNGEYLSIGFYIAESGNYDLSLDSWEDAAGGKVDIVIDGQIVKPGFSFHSPAKTARTVKPLMNGVRLDKGVHTLTFKAAQTMKLPSNNRYYIYLYLQEFRLTAKEIFNELNEVTLIAPAAYLNTNQEIPLTVSGKMAGGAAADLSGAQYVYTSSNPNVVEVTQDAAGGAKASARSNGRVYIKTAVTLNGVTRESTVQLHVGAHEQSLIFDFKKPVSSKLAEAGWELGGGTIGAVSSQPYGMLATGNKIGDTLRMRISVPEEGYYELRLTGAAGAGGAIATVSLNGTDAGSYNFYLASAANVKSTAGMRTVFLAAGVHDLAFTITGRYGLSNNYQLLLNQLQLVRVGGLPSLQSLDLSLSKPELMAGQTSRFSPLGLMADGYTYNIMQASPSSVTSSVYDPTIAAFRDPATLIALKPGTTTVTAQVYLDGIGMTAYRPMVVNTDTLQAVTLSADKPEVSVGMTGKLSVTGSTNGKAVDLGDASIIFSSLTPNIATVAQDGTIQALAIGTVQFKATVTLGPATITGQVSVKIVPPYLTDLTVSMFRPKTFVGEKRRLDFFGKLNNGKNADLTQAAITYSSSNPTAVSVDAAGVLDMKAVGTSTITASVNLDGVTKSGTVNVEVQTLTSAKTRTTYYTDAKMTNARTNVSKYDWAGSIRDSAVARADRYLAKGADYVWSMVPANSLPRGIYVNQALGSPVSGREIYKLGDYPWQGDAVNEPWKIVDPVSGYKFPTNDFGKYYRSGLDEHGFFDPKRADRSLLVNELYPEKGPNWGVDDGFGWIDEFGNRYTFIAYYMHWYQWYGGGTALIQNALNAARDAYLYSGDPKYAEYGIILLDRIADVYPELDISKFDGAIYANSQGGTFTGKAVGRIWETGLVREFVQAYDAFFPAFQDPAVMDPVLSFFSGKRQSYDLPLKGSATGIKRNIEDGIVKQVFPGVKAAQIHGNNGFHQSTLAMAAVVYDTLPETKEWLDFNYKAGGLVSGPWRVTGGNILATMVNDLDRDGEGDEAAPEYLRYWLSSFENVAAIMDGYDKYPEGDLYQNVKFRKMYQSIYPLLMSELYIPNIGDTGKTGDPGLYMLNKTQAIKAFEKFGDPAYAQLAHFMNNNRLDGIHGDIFSAEPEKIAADIEKVIAEKGPFKLESNNLTGFGLAALRDGENVKFDYGVPYFFPSLPVTASTKEYKVFDNLSVLQFEAAAVGDSITFEFNVAQSDTYELSLKPYRAASYGKYRILLDDSELVASYDFFGSAYQHEPIGSVTLTAGKHRITFESMDKADLSTGYKLGLSELALLNAAERERRDASHGNTLRDTWMYYGRTAKHGHSDTLNLGMHAYGMDLLPDLGYPEVANDVYPQRHEWMNNTISHNTVMVDEQRQKKDIWDGSPTLFDDGQIVQLMEVEAPKVYDAVSMYKRTTAMIRVNEKDSYAVDFFRVKGGSDHHFSFHAAEGSVATEGLELAAQPTGTYAGPDVEYGMRPADDSAPGWSYTGPGFHFLKNVERDSNPSDQFSVDWNIEDTWDVHPLDRDIHLRLTMLGETQDVALADGIPSQNKPGNPESIRYLIAHRQGTNLDSTFTSVIEPYENSRYIASIDSAKVTVNGQPADQEVRAVKVTLKNGRTDYVVSSLDSNTSYMIDGRIAFKGTFGVYAEKDGSQIYGYAADGNTIGGVNLQKASLSGTIADFTKTMSINNFISVTFAEPVADAEKLVGRYLYAKNDGQRNAVYRIKGIQSQEGSTIKFDIGDVTTIRKWVDVNDFQKGFVYDIAAGAAVSIPMSAEELKPQFLLSAKSEMWEGDSQELKTELLYPDERSVALTDGVQFSSSNPAVASVDSAGHVTALQEGTAVITASYKDKQATAAVKVMKPYLESLLISGEAEMIAGETQILEVFGVYSNGAKIQLTQDIELESANHSIVKVEQDGSIRAIREGATTIKVSYQGKTAQFNISIQKRNGK